MNLAKEVGRTAREKGRTIAFAESITGGLVGSLVTDVPGSSDYFLASLVTYSNRSKIEILGVEREALERHGAVSSEVARQMARGARRVIGADIGASITGIAGPTGGSAEKPTGLVYFAVCDADREVADRRVFSGTRISIKRQAADRLLEMVLAFIRTERGRDDQD